MRKKETSFLPYLQGGVPGALRAFIGMEAVFSIISGAVSCIVLTIGIISALSVRGSGFLNGWTAFFLIPLYIFLSVYGIILSVRLFVGLTRLCRDDSSGAYDAEKAVRGRRILLWIVFSLLLFSELYSVINLSARGYSSSAGFLIFLILTGILLPFAILFHCYYKNCERVLNHISGELYSRRGIRIAGIGHLSGLCVALAVIVLVFSALIYSVNSLPGASYSDWYNILYEPAALLLYLCAARFLLTGLCYRGFRRSHAPLAADEDAQLAPSGISGSPAVCVLGSVFLGWFAFSNHLSDLNLLIEGFPFSPGYFIPGILISAAFILLGIALAHRPGRTVLTVVGASVAVAEYMYELIGNLIHGNTFSDTVSYVLIILHLILMIHFFLLLIAAVLIRRSGKNVPPVFRILMIVLGSLSVVFGRIPLLISAFSYWRYYSQNIIGLFWSFFNNLLFLLPLLGLVRMTGIPGDTPDSSSTAEEPEKKAVVSLRKSEE